MSHLQQQYPPSFCLQSRQTRTSNSQTFLRSYQKWRFAMDSSTPINFTCTELQSSSWVACYSFVVDFVGRWALALISWCIRHHSLWILDFWFCPGLGRIKAWPTNFEAWCQSRPYTLCLDQVYFARLWHWSGFGRQGWLKFEVSISVFGKGLEGKESTQTLI